MIGLFQALSLNISIILFTCYNIYCIHKQDSSAQNDYLIQNGLIANHTTMDERQYCVRNPDKLRLGYADSTTNMNPAAVDECVKLNVRGIPLRRRSPNVKKAYESSITGAQNSLDS